ncbi:hypothetical protein PPL_03001 [Heterostelium album PN500]|uniref:Uncharacterized protein n=1 Tax=Heterostelium pallidum (strain ATCC 26659 / Pp 5 / PN500) TaxID=670386 RepID=D3B3N3_HETP5|nr:hypothetical protein PPL_03001 [Heterostelium album PN500]EFA83931.1 hypothetical protein PPL_03001 [Heterostelium album PN500]|eukprot:XP_020436048.1 hypothetical protein PPL_03001 [Heterostelium album PN500]
MKSITILCILFILLFVLNAQVNGNTLNFKPNFQGTFSDPASWVENVAPLSNDSVIISSPGSICSINDTNSIDSITVWNNATTPTNSLYLVGANLTIANTLSVKQPNTVFSCKKSVVKGQISITGSSKDIIFDDCNFDKLYNEGSIKATYISLQSQNIIKLENSGQFYFTLMTNSFIESLIANGGLFYFLQGKNVSIKKLFANETQWKFQMFGSQISIDSLESQNGLFGQLTLTTSQLSIGNCSIIGGSLSANLEGSTLSVPIYINKVDFTFKGTSSSSYIFDGSNVSLERGVFDLSSSKVQFSKNSTYLHKSNFKLVDSTALFQDEIARMDLCTSSIVNSVFNMDTKSFAVNGLLLNSTNSNIIFGATTNGLLSGSTLNITQNSNITFNQGLEIQSSSISIDTSQLVFESPISINLNSYIQCKHSIINIKSNVLSNSSSSLVVDSSIINIKSSQFLLDLALINTSITIDDPIQLVSLTLDSNSNSTIQLDDLLQIDSPKIKAKSLILNGIINIVVSNNVFDTLVNKSDPVPIITCDNNNAIYQKQLIVNFSLLDASRAESIANCTVFTLTSTGIYIWAK